MQNTHFVETAVHANGTFRAAIFLKMKITFIRNPSAKLLLPVFANLLRRSYFILFQIIKSLIFKSHSFCTGRIVAFPYFYGVL